MTFNIDDMYFYWTFIHVHIGYASGWLYMHVCSPSGNIVKVTDALTYGKDNDTTFVCRPIKR
jgi:hypothetical protein